MFVQRTLDTEVGPVEIAITRAAHVSVQGHPVIRDTKYNAHFHFHAQPDGTFDVKEEDRPTMSRAWKEHDRNLKFRDPAPPTHLAKVIAAYKAALNAFLATNPELLVQAEDEDIERDIGTAEGKVAAAQKALNEANAALEVLRAKRRKHQLAQVRKNSFKVEIPCAQRGCAISYPHAQH
jgi:hypothetical protein